MKKKIISTVIFSVTAMLVGIILLLCAFAASGFDYNGFNGRDMKLDQYTVDAQAFDEIDIDTSTVDVEIMVGTDIDKTYIDVYQDSSAPHNVKYENGKLTIESGERPWYKNIGIFWGKCKITVLLPSGIQGNLNIESDTGGVNIGALSFESISLSTDTGDITCSASASGEINIETDTGDVDITSSAPSIRVESDTGDVTLHRTVATDNLYITTSTGDVEIEGADAPNIYIKTSTGDVDAIFYTGKLFEVNTSTGDRDVPTSDPSGGRCEITTSTGDIEVDIRKPITAN